MLQKNRSFNLKTGLTNVDFKIESQPQHEQNIRQMCGEEILWSRA